MKIGIVGYGNIGRGIEAAIKQNKDAELVAVFTRRDPATVKVATKGVPVYSVNEIEKKAKDFDILVMCGGSRSDLPKQTPEYVKYCNVIDTFDTHPKIPEHFANVDKAATASNHVALISCGWDPGLFSLNRLIGSAVLPNGVDYTFWGKGVSEGHSDAIRRIKGVKDAKEYTIPVDKALKAVRAGETPELTVRDKHVRDCYVVLEEGVNESAVEHEIKTMPDYFADYDTMVHFISQEEFDKNHKAMPHGGSVFRTGVSDNNNKSIIEFNLKLDSNPEFTASVVIAYARAVCRMAKEGQKGCKTIFDVPPAYLLDMTSEEIRKQLL
ncbi:MAG: diaminopimelate dehydrogenase [Lachnospiraceae bacterium]|nr:diaminopimelate dehydrogenase [Lachnospiraceae bacterium]